MSVLITFFFFSLRRNSS